MKAFVLFLFAYLFSNNISTAAQDNKNVAKNVAQASSAADKRSALQDQSAIAAADTAERKSSGAIKGVVLDKTTKKPLAGVNIIVEGTRRGTTTNQDGAFIIAKIESGKYTLRFEHIGYAGKKHDTMILPGKTVDLQSVEMKERAISLKEIVVTPGSYSIMGSEPSLRQTLTSEDIKMMGWAEDITRALRRIPGISANDFSAKFSIRGGDVDEVLVLLDGMQIYKPFHQKDFGGGLFSTVDIETIDGVDLLTGGFAANHGDRLSGVLNMRTKTPKEGQRQTSVGFSLMNLRAFSSGTFNNNKGAWLFSARRGYLDLVNRLMKNEFKLQPRYYDLMGKAEYQLNQKHSLSVHGFFSNDKYKLDEKVLEKGRTTFNIDFVDTKYGNNYGWLTLKSLLSPQLHAQTIFYGGAVTQKRYWNVFDFDPNAHLNSATINDDRKLGLIGIKQDWDYEPAKNVLLKFGLEAKRLNVKLNYSNQIENEFIAANDSLIEQREGYKADQTQTGSQAGIYWSSRFQLLSPLAVEAGVRYDYASHTNDKLWSPRLGVVYSLAKATFLRAGWGYYYQTQGLDELNIQFKETSYQPAKLAKHFVLGFEHLFNNGIHFRMEGYYKRMSRLPDAYFTFRDIDEFFPEVRDDLIKLSAARATSKGIELYLKHDTGNKFSWWLSYVLSEAKDEVTDIQYAGRLVKQTGNLPRAWDQRHTVNIDANYRLNKKWHFNFGWQYRSGWPYTSFEVKRLQRADGSFAYYHDYGKFYGSRYPSYQRLDARLNRQFYTASGKITAFLHVINLYNHENISSYDHDILAENPAGFRYEIAKETWFGIMPFAGVSWEF